MDSRERRAFAEIERSLRLEDPLVRRLRRIGRAAGLAGAATAVLGLGAGSALGGVGIFVALAGWALLVAAPTIADWPGHRW